MNVNTDVEELINYLESKDLEIVNYFKNVVQEKLYTSKDQYLLGTLMDRYIQTKAEALLELLIGVNDTLAMYLFDRLNDHLKHGACIEVCTILFSIVKKQPSWLHKIIGTSLFATFLKSLKNDQDIVFIMHGILILCSLIPCVPAIIGPHHGDILDVFVRTAGFLVNKASAIPEVCALHLNVGIYIFFHRLYTMYPNNFLNYMRSCFGGNRRKDPVFQEVIKPMFEFVKFHPDLITDTSKSETGLEKWKVYQPHDVLVECQKISLDQHDIVKEATYAVYDSQLEDIPYPVHSGEGVSLSILNSYFSHPDSISLVTSMKKDANEQQEHEICKERLPSNQSLCNPSEICGLTTPPPSMTRSDSTQDISSSHCGTKCDSESRDSNQTLNDIPDRLVRSSTGTFSNTSNQSPASKRSIVKTTSFGSGDTFSHRTMFKSLLSNSTCHSTPVDQRQSINTSAPASPRKGSIHNKRPQSTEFFRYKKEMSKPFELDHISDSFSVHSAPNSPMVPVGSLHFTFNADTDVEGKFKSQEELNNDKEKIKKLNVLPCHSLNHNSHVKYGITDKHDSSSNQPSYPVVFLKSIREMFLELFPTVSKCCRDSLDQMETASLSSSNNFKKRSPLNLLDDFIQYGSDIHSYHLSRVPLTSQLDTDWTYYGGSTPIDELKILQTQVHLLHIQLQYERYKCELHCLRNRRLFGSLQKTQKAHDEVDTLKDQILLAESKLREMKLAVGFKCKENQQMKQQSFLREQEYMTKICTLEEENNNLEYKLKNYKLKKQQERRKVISLEEELQRVKYKLFDVAQKYNHVQPKLSQLGYYQAVTNSLEKELLIQYDKQESLKIRVDKSQLHLENHIDLENKLTAHRNELKALQDEKETIHVHAESLKLKLNELELSNGKKDSLIMEQKLNSKKLHLKHKIEIEALESRFQSCRKSCQSLQSYITCLFAKLEEPHTCQNSTTQASPGPFNATRCTERCRKVSYSGPGSPRPLSMHDQSHRHSFNNGENPFRTKKPNLSIEVVGEKSKEDSGIGESSDILNNCNS